jgi:acyl-CoA synthetase (AMP-forming)/AMP-acid ligase II
MDFSFPQVMETIAGAVPDREAIVWRDRRFTFQQYTERSRSLANYLAQRGYGTSRERVGLQGHESGQDHLALYLYNGNEYLEGMLGAFYARVAPFNVNYRYVEEELIYLFQNSRARVVVYHAEFAPRLEAIMPHLPDLELCIHVKDESGNTMVPGAVDYDDVIESTATDLPTDEPSPDDLYILYTGGTTGMPKGVLWRSADIYMAAMGGRKLDGVELASLEDIAAYAAAGGGAKAVIGPPLMHGAAQWATFFNFAMGNTVVFPTDNKKLEPHDFLSTIERERAISCTIVGDAFARPILDQLDEHAYDLSGLFVIGSGGAPLSAKNKQEFLRKIPHVTVLDSIGSSESGVQASNPSNKDSGVSTGDFKPGVGACVVAEDLTHLLHPGDDSLGWFAQTGRCPLGYLADAGKTERTFPVIEGVRYAVPGDRARYRADGSIEVLGRDSVTINSGGEKIFAEEVEAALKQHPGVFDVVVAGRPSERWGQEVVAIVHLRAGSPASATDLIEEAGKHIARYKLPKEIVFRDAIQRSPSGKADYRWAKEQAEGS